ncbi:MAG: hypothetical protein JSR83_02305 [Proteobacteria bacterium]|nr:hypothetical protein [Pseudomonadota bacterium]
MANIYKSLLSILPSNPLLVGTVVAATGDELRISLPDGSLASAKGNFNVGDFVFFRPGGVVEGMAPTLDFIEIDV